MAGTRLIRYLLAADTRRIDKQALILHRKAMRRAERRLKKSGKLVILNGDAAAPELEWLLRGVSVYFADCFDDTVYQTLKQAVDNWLPITTDTQQQAACALVQTVLLSVLRQCRQKQRLEQLCAQYQDHLAQAASRELKKQPQSSERMASSQDLDCLSPVSVPIANSLNHSSLPVSSKPVSVANQALARIREKQDSVNRLRQVWTTRQDLFTQCQQFQTIFQQERRVLEKDRDSTAMTFVKAITTVLTLGLAALLGIWSVEGQKTTQQIAQILETPAPDMN